MPSVEPGLSTCNLLLVEHVLVEREVGRVFQSERLHALVAGLKRPIANHLNFGPGGNRSAVLGQDRVGRVEQLWIVAIARAGGWIKANSERMLRVRRKILLIWNNKNGVGHQTFLKLLEILIIQLGRVVGVARKTNLCSKRLIFKRNKVNGCLLRHVVICFVLFSQGFLYIISLYILLLPPVTFTATPLHRPDKIAQEGNSAWPTGKFSRTPAPALMSGPAATLLDLACHQFHPRLAHEAILCADSF
ncbi:hypothetical protein OGAPHI_005270 [Ogataea philodendri]|uniref:Uncharacterized protein n=1 Tax=Ogataea philodendri TaxID=1378263 RepID=A0A9P8P2Y4_9ASCO|nr:uncharacterized protein OGAPHI_005270 [Ogataea philodendri]KAH3663867.1 hypothetical protein OGAPHI_005270 [Ogataea philodendri]